MQRHGLLLRLAVVLSSVLLAAGCVGYHAGAFNGLLRPSTTSPAGRSPEVAPPGKPTTVMSGTKSFNPDQFISGLTPADSSWGAMEKPSDEEILRIIRGPEQAGSSPSEPGVPGSPPK